MLSVNRSGHQGEKLQEGKSSDGDGAGLKSLELR